MATTTPDALFGIYKLIAPYFKTDKQGGISNPNSPGYHTSREDLHRQGRASNYSIQAPADRRGPANAAAGIDITFGSLDELITMHKRLRKACTPNSDGDYDPRIEPVREIIGTLDGRTVSGYNRYATGSGNRSRVGWVASGFSDSSHLWHEHVSIFRAYVDDWNAMRGVAEVMAGVPKGKFGWKGDEASASKPAAPVSVHQPKPAPIGEAKAPTGRTIYLDKLKPGQKNSDSVWLLQNLLNKVLGPNLIRTGTYDAATVAHVKMFQADVLKWDVKSANGDAGPNTVKELIKRAGKGYGYKVEDKS